MKYKLFVIAVVVSFTTIFSQTRYQIEVDLGTSFQSKVKLNDNVLDHSNTFAARFGANIQIPVYQIFLEIGVFGKYNRGNNEIEILKFKSNSLRFQIPFYIGYGIDDKWKVSLGTSIENNRDFKNLNSHKKHNLRYDFLTKVVYQHTDQIHYVFYTNWSLTRVPYFYNISNPKNGIFIGLVYQFKKIRREDEK